MAPGWLNGWASPSAQVEILGSWDRVLHWVSHREPAFPSACVSASLCVSLMNKWIKSFKKNRNKTPWFSFLLLQIFSLHMESMCRWSLWDSEDTFHSFFGFNCCICEDSCQSATLTKSVFHLLAGLVCLWLSFSTLSLWCLQVWIFISLILLGAESVEWFIIRSKELSVIIFLYTISSSSCAHCSS